METKRRGRVNETACQGEMGKEREHLEEETGRERREWEEKLVRKRGHLKERMNL